MDGSNHSVNISAATINKINEVTSYIQIVPVSIKNGGNRLRTFDYLDIVQRVSNYD